MPEVINGRPNNHMAMWPSHDDTVKLLDAIVAAGRILGQVLDNPSMHMRPAEPMYTDLSRAFSALSATYYQTTGQPLEWWQED